MKNQKKKKKIYIIEVDELKFNKSIEIQYAKSLNYLKKEMFKDYLNQILSFYKNNLSSIIFDYDFPSQLNDLINSIGKKWEERFSYYSSFFAKKTINNIEKHNQTRFKKLVEKNPFLLGKNAINERKKMLQIVEASVQENVGLIKSIPKKFHDQIQGSVMRSMAQGGNIAGLVKDLKKISNQTTKRIELIARDQTAKATALVDRAKAEELGFTTGIWKKSIAGKTHRKEHAAVDGKEFDLKKGMLIQGKYTFPRMEINCKCSYKLIMKKYDEE